MGSQQEVQSDDQGNQQEVLMVDRTEKDD